MELWDLGFLEWPWGSPERPQGSPVGGQGFPNEFPSGAQGIPREVRFPEARDPLAAWMGWLCWLGSMEGWMGYYKICVG